MKKPLIAANLFAGIIALTLLIYISLYGPVLIVPFERMISLCAANHSAVAAQDLLGRLKEAHNGYYYFIAVPLLGLFFILIVFVFNIFCFYKWNRPGVNFRAF